MFRRIALSGIAALLFLAVISIVMLRSKLESRGPTFASPRIVAVASGDSILAIAQRLAAAHVVEDEVLFAALARWRSVDRRIRTEIGRAHV